MTREKLSTERHREIGVELKHARDFLTQLTVELSAAAGKSARSTRAAARAQSAVDELRSELDRLLFSDHVTEADVRIYYPGGAR